MKIVVTGATGFIGVPLVEALVGRGDTVTVLSRDAVRAKHAFAVAVTAIAADLQAPGAWCQALAGSDAVVHLAGESMASKRWDARQKQVLRDSRVESTRTLVEAIGQLAADQRPRVLVSASGTDYYPFAPDTEFDDDPVTEVDPAGDSFLARLCRDWEKEALAGEALELRVVRMRTGLVLGSGGALAKLTTPFKLFVGGKLGSGRQWVPWIHREDAVRGYLTAISDQRYTGPINLVAHAVRNVDLSHAIGSALQRPSWLPVPAFALRAAVGELAEYLLNGRRVHPARLHALEFEWTHSTLDGALGASM